MLAWVIWSRFWEMSRVQYSIATDGRCLKVRNWIWFLFWLVSAIKPNISQCSIFSPNVCVAKHRSLWKPVIFLCWDTIPICFLRNIENPWSIRLYMLLIEMYFESHFERYLSTKYRWSINSCVILNGSVLDYFCRVLS